MGYVAGNRVGDRAAGRQGDARLIDIARAGGQKAAGAARLRGGPSVAGEGSRERIGDRAPWQCPGPNC